jgi:multidrug efflux pump subunit AcrB
LAIALPVSALPQVDYPIIQVYTFQPGANPDTVQRTITAPLEREMGKIAGLKQMSSNSSVGASVITLQFELSAELGWLNKKYSRHSVRPAVNYPMIYHATDLPQSKSCRCACDYLRSVQILYPNHCL